MVQNGKKPMCSNEDPKQPNNKFLKVKKKEYKLHEYKNNFIWFVWYHQCLECCMANNRCLLNIFWMKEYIEKLYIKKNCVNSSAYFIIISSSFYVDLLCFLVCKLTSTANNNFDSSFPILMPHLFLLSTYLC